MKNTFFPLCRFVVGADSLIFANYILLQHRNMYYGCLHTYCWLWDDSKRKQHSVEHFIFFNLKSHSGLTCSCGIFMIMENINEENEAYSCISEYFVI